MSIKQAIEALEEVADRLDGIKGGSVSESIRMLRAALAALRSMPAEPVKRCPYCDDTGDVHSIDGEWRGTCKCPAGATTHTEAVRQALTDPENQPNQFGVTFGMRGPKMYFAIGHQSFTLDYAPEEPGEFEFMRDMLTKAMSVFTPDVKPEAVRMSEAWISVDERLPNPWEDVLIYPKPTDYCCEGRVDNKGQWTYSEYEQGFGDVTHKIQPRYWQPLPPPPVEQATAARLGVKLGDV